jgi:hypothetical protein
MALWASFCCSWFVFFTSRLAFDWLLSTELRSMSSCSRIDVICSPHTSLDEPYCWALVATGFLMPRPPSLDGSVVICRTYWLILVPKRTGRSFSVMHVSRDCHALSSDGGQYTLYKVQLLLKAEHVAGVRRVRFCLRNFREVADHLCEFCNFGCQIVLSV